MTVLPATPEAPVEAAPPSRSSKSPSDQSKDFYSYLRSNAQDDTDETSGSVGKPAAKPQKREKQTEKADGNQTADDSIAPVQPQAEKPPPPISLEALLGLPVAPKTDPVQTGIVTNNDANGKTALPPLEAANGSAALPAAQLSLLGAAAPVFKNATTKENGSLPSQPSQKGSSHIAASVDPAALLGFITPQLSNVVSSPADVGKVDPANAISSAVGSEAKGDNVESLLTGASSSAAASAAAPGNLAFALKLNEVPTNQKANGEAPPQTSFAESIAGAAPSANTDLATTVIAAAGSQLKEQSHQQESSGSALYQVSSTPEQKIADASQHTQEQPVQTTAADLEAKQADPTAEPVRNIHMQVVGDTNNRVDVRLTDRGGELHVSVKSADTNLAQNLQDHMPELTSRLEQQKFQTEVWMPRLGDNAKSEMSGSRDFSSGGNSNPNSNNSSDQQGKRQQQYKPDWVDVLENSTQGARKSDQIWRQ